MNRKQFWFGVGFATCIDSFKQDILGKEKYLELTKILWVETHWSLWLGLSILFLMASEISYSSKEKHHDSRNKNPL